MKIIVGLGNVGSEYDHTRHNVGFNILDAIAKANTASNFQAKRQFRAQVAEYTDASGEKVILVKPTTFYNLSGLAVQAIGDFYKINFAEDLLVIHDDLSLDFGTIKLRNSGSDGGNKGIRSIIEHVGNQFRRIRIGTKSDRLEFVSRTNFVLEKFTPDEQERLDQVTPELAELISNFLSNHFVNTRINF